MLSPWDGDAAPSRGLSGVMGMVAKSRYVSVAGLEKDPATPASQARKRTGSSEEACDPTSAAAQLHWLRRHLPPASPPSPR